MHLDNQLTDQPRQGITQIDSITTDKGQQTDTRPKTKEMKTNQISKAKTNNNNNNKQIQQPETKLRRKTTLKSENYNNRETTNTHQQQKNVTVRKAKITPTTQYYINGEPLPKTTDNYPEIPKTTRTTENKCSTSPLQKNAQSDKTIIPERQTVPETQTQEATQLSFLSTSMLRKT